MRVDAPTITETATAIIIRIPKGWVTPSPRPSLTEDRVIRMVAAGEREFRAGKTQEFGVFLAKRHPAHARAFRRAR